MSTRPGDRIIRFTNGPVRLGDIAHIYADRRANDTLILRDESTFRLTPEDTELLSEVMKYIR